MSSEMEWPRLSLKEAGVTLIDCDHRTPPAADEGYPYIAIPQLKNGHIDLDGVRRISRKHLLEWTKKLKPQTDDVIVVRRCNSGDSAVVPRGLECAIGQNLIILRADGEVVQPKFLRWLLRGPDWWEQVRKYINVGAVFDSLKCKEIPLFELTVPPITEQKKISEILGALDGRIALLRETNATLEAIAQALFKSWFVDFDPVHAKQQGRAPEGDVQGSTSVAEGRMPEAALDEATAALFPDSFEESELGLVPRGWRVAQIGNAVEIVGGGTPDTKVPDYWEPAEYCWTTPKDLSGIQSPVLLTTERKLAKKGVEKVSSGLLPAGTLLMSSRAPIGYLAIAQTPLAINQGYIAILPSSQLPPLYMLFWCRQNMDHIKGRANGSTFMEISKKAFRPIPALVPPRPVIDAFTNVASTLFDRLVENEKQAQTLAILRDSLLPRLILGQLRLPEVSASLV